MIVVDDCSEPPLAESFVDDASTRLDIEFVTLSTPSGPAAGRNAGVAASDAELIVFVDDDVLPNRHFIEAHVAAVTGGASDGRPVVSCGPFVQPADWDPTPWNLWEARQAKKEADSLTTGRYDITWRQFHTGNNCLPRSVFLDAGGFDETFKRAEDDELALRLQLRGCVFRFEPGAIAWHYSNRSLDSWLAIPRAYAHYDVQIDRQHPELGYLAMKKAELATRDKPLRAARLICAGPRRTRIGVSVAVSAARLLHRIGLVDTAMGAFSVAYDLTYVDSMRENERAVVAASAGTSC